MNTGSIFSGRSHHEAADAGILLWRENFINFIPFFAVPFWIFAFSLRILLPVNYQYLSWIIAWLSKPLFDRIILHIISIKFFDREADFKRLKKGLWKTLLRGLPGDLLWRRLSPLRSVLMPMRVLERNLKTRKAISERKYKLKKGGIDYCFLLTVWGIAAEVILLAGAYIFYLLFNQLVFDTNVLWLPIQALEIYLYAFWCINLILIETIYINMGFCVYINSRIMVEGWDIELTFRNFAEKFKEKAKNAVFLFILVFLLSVPGNVYSSGDPLPPDFQTADEIPFETLNKVLESRDFGGEEEAWRIRLKEREKEDRTISRENRYRTDRFLIFIAKLREASAVALVIIITGLIALILILLFIFMRKNKKSKIDYDSAPETRNMDINESENPELLLIKALNLHEEGEIRLAWGFCTAASIWSWKIYHGINFPPNATENDCARIVCKKTNNSPEAEGFGRLIKNWILLVYAERQPPEGSFEEAVNLCRSITVSGENKNG